jgi:hypothetical protein
MNYTTVFDASRPSWHNLGFVAFGLIFVAIGLVLVFVPGIAERFARFPKSLRRPFAWFYLVFAVIWTTFAGSSVLLDALSARQSLQDRTCEIVTGPVTHFHPMPYDGHDLESFDVQGQRFAYSDFIVSAGFNRTTSHGGPIREGLPVRICHLDGEILRLEVGA